MKFIDSSGVSACAFGGLMTIAPNTEDPETNRQFFCALRKLSVDIADKNIDNIHMGVLSMGMTNDYEVAIEEGAQWSVSVQESLVKEIML